MRIQRVVHACAYLLYRTSRLPVSVIAAIIAAIIATLDLLETIANISEAVSVSTGLFFQRKLSG